MKMKKIYLSNLFVKTMKILRFDFINIPRVPRRRKLILLFNNILTGKFSFEIDTKWLGSKSTQFKAARIFHRSDKLH